MPTVVMPVKAVAVKSRLAPALSPAQRRRLSELMLLDVLDAFSDTGLLVQCLVVSASRRIRELARGTGALAIAEGSDSGVNAAVETGSRQTKSDYVMVVPSDLPLLKASDILGALSILPRRFDVVMAPSADFDGTNLLVFSRSNPLPLSFDRNSFWNHLTSAARLGLKVCIYSAKGFRFDVDSIPHLHELARSRLARRSVLYAREVLRR